MSERKKIVIIGAGRSSAALVRYLSKHSNDQHWEIKVLDRSQEVADQCCKGMKNCQSKAADALNPDIRRGQLEGADMVVSMLPARFHMDVAKDCVEMGINLITPSYVSDEMRELDEEARNKGVLLLNEMGLDPGIDHMSAMKILDELRSEGAEIEVFKSFTGGLIAPESDNNPWHYKFTWNPRNVVLAGQGGAVQFIRNGLYKYIPYHDLFRRVEPIHIEGYGEFEGYANRNSLQYRLLYGIDNIPTIFRGTLRRQGFCAAWNVFVQLGMTDDAYRLENSEEMTYRDFVNTYLRYDEEMSVEDKLCEFMGIERKGKIMSQLEWLGIFEQRKVGLPDATPAQVLQHLLEEKWTLKPDDKDMIAMYHYFEYIQDGEKKSKHSYMVTIGEDQTYTGMARTVGLPIGIAVKLILTGKFKESGVHLPTMPELYIPILSELESLGIKFSES